MTEVIDEPELEFFGFDGIVGFASFGVVGWCVVVTHALHVSDGDMSGYLAHL